MPGYLTDGMPGVPVGYAFTGQELIPVDTGLPAGQTPQTFACPISAFGFPAVDASVQITGFTYTVPVGINSITFNPAGTLATGTIVFPKGVFNGQKLRIFSSQIVTSLTLTAASGDTIATPLTALAANTAYEYVYATSNSTWNRVL